MHLENALEIAGRLRDALASEVESARAERVLLRALDAAGLFARAEERSRFLADVARLERDLASSLAHAAGALGLTDVTIEALQLRAPPQAERLARSLSDVRALAGALREIDRLNLEIAGRALSCVRGYVQALQPAPSAYDRRGGRAGVAPALSMVSSKV